MAKRVTLATFDTPIVFVTAVVLVIVPILALLGALARKVGAPSPVAVAGFAPAQ